MSFTTRPEITGTFGVVTSTHWIASAVGMKILEAGGNAFDAAVATGFTLQVVEPHLNGPLGEVPALVCRAGEDAPTVICGQGVAPARATIEHYRAEGLALVPGTGHLAAVVPGALDAWLLMLRDWGTMELAEVLAPALHYARTGHPLLPRVAATIAGVAEMFREEWPSSARVFLPGGAPPAPGALFANPELADFWERLLAEAAGATARGAAGREARIEAARRAASGGFVAEAIDSFVREATPMDATGERRRGVLSGDDIARWRASCEPALACDTHGLRVWKTGPWGQGPVLLQALRLMEGIVPDDLDGPDFVHLCAEALKLAMADREAYYGDPDFVEVPLEELLSDAYTAARRALIGAEASFATRPGRLDPALADAAIARAAAGAAGGEAVPGAVAGSGEPTMAHLSPREGDTCHLDVIDAAGNMVSATPSGGWLQSNPVVPGLGVPLGTRAQMFWLDPGRPSALGPGRRPRTTLTPTMAGRGRPSLACGTPGGDQQDQWQLALLLRLAHGGANLQAAIDAPLFHTAHPTSSFYPRGSRPGHLMVEPAFGEATIAALAARGHGLEVSEPWAIGRLCAARRNEDGTVAAAATPRLMQAYAIGR